MCDGAHRIRDAKRVSRAEACVAHTVRYALLSRFTDGRAPCFSPNEALELELVSVWRRFDLSPFRDHHTLVLEIASNFRRGTKIEFAPQGTLGVIQAWGARGLVFAGG